MPKDTSAESPIQRLASLLLGQPVVEWCKQRRSSDLSYRRVATELREATSGQVDVTDEAIRRWCLDRDEDGAAA